MKARIHIVWVCLLTVVTGCVVMDMDAPVGNQEEQLRPSPKFPASDVARGNEGWVLVAYKISSSGLVIEPHVTASSGRSSFDYEALTAIRKWRYAPGEERQTSVLVSFEFENKVPNISKGFYDMYMDTHEQIDAGEFDAAEASLEKWREDTHSPYEVAFIYLAWARIAGYRGDLDLQLQFYRQAMLHKGRWLAPENYQECLRASVMLEIILEDYATAVRDYELLIASGAANETLADLEDSIKSARAILEHQQIAPAPYSLAQTTVAVTRARRDRDSFHAGGMPEGPPTGRGATPPVPRQ